METLAAAPAPPASLSAGAKREWRKVAKRLHGLGILTALDLGAVEAYCILRDRALQCEKDVARDGRTVEGSQGIKRHPSLITAEKCWADCRRYEAEFGFTPSARRSLNIAETEPAAAETPAEQWLRQYEAHNAAARAEAPQTARARFLAGPGGGAA